MAALFSNIDLLGTTAFLRAIAHGCQGPEQCHKLEVAKSDPAWDLIQKGWSWLVSHRGRDQWPVLPSFIQMGLNISNAIGAVNELEVAASLCQFIEGGMTLNEAMARPNLVPWHVLNQRCQENHELVAVLGGVKVQGKWTRRSSLAGSDPESFWRTSAKAFEKAFN